MPGTMALGYQNGLPKDHMEIATRLTRTCYEMYNKMPTKLSPEIVYFNQAPGSSDDLIVKVSTMSTIYCMMFKILSYNLFYYLSDFLIDKLPVNSIINKIKVPY